MTHLNNVFEHAIPPSPPGATQHAAMWGPSGYGKTQCMIAMGRTILRDPAWGFHQVDVEGDISPDHLEFLASPQNNLGWRKLHYLQVTSKTHSFALPMLHVRDRTALECHRATIRTVTVLNAAINFGLGDYGPRLYKLLHFGCFGLALAGRPVIDLPDLYAQGAAYFRQQIADQFPYQFMSDEFRSLDVLNDRTFIEYRDALMSRLLPIFGNDQLRRVFGPQPPVDIAAILQNRECVLLDLGGLEHRDAVLVGTAYLSLFYHEAIQRPPNRAPHTALFVDEAFDYLSPDFCRGFDRLRKRNVQLVIAVQRLGQLA